jgi:glycosyltransferase involved in cell wall biosynthesis
MLGYLPPPYFGPSVTYRALLRSAFSQEFDIKFVDITVAETVDDIERFRPGKLAKMIGFLLREFWLLLTGRFDFCCCPISVNRNAFVKDALLMGLGRLFRVPTVLYAHGNNLPDFCDKSSPRVRRLVEHTCRQAAGAIVLGESLRFNFERWLPAEKIFVVPTGIEPAESLPAACRHDGVTVLYLGNLIREKGVFVLLEAARQCPDVKFVFAGSWFRSGDETAAKQLAGANVQFIGPVAGASKWRALADADMLAFPTYYYNETMGLVLLEAMQCSLPVVTTRRASIPEIIRDGEHGLLVNEQDAGDLAEKIRRLAGDAGLRERMGRAGRERFLAYYTHMQYGQRMAQVFETLARR